MASLPPCIGYDSAAKRWGWGALGDDEKGYSCPANTAVFAVNSLWIPEDEFQIADLPFNCCPVPADLLTTEIFLADDDCGSEAIITGSHFDETRRGASDPNRGVMQFICTKINSSRYLLTEAEGIPISAYPRRIQQKVVSDLSRRGLPQEFLRINLPLALRFGLGRYDFYRWQDEFCAGYPWGALLTGKHSRKICPFKFRQLRFRIGGKTVPLVPECRAISSVYDENASCVAN